MLWPPTPESFCWKSIPNALFAVALSSWTSNETFWATTVPMMSLALSDGAGPLGAGVEPPTVPDQQSGNGVEEGAGAKLGSTQPLNVSTLPLASRIGSFSDALRTVNVSFEGARMKLMRS